VAIKAGVLGGDDGLFQNVRNLLRGDFHPSFDGEIPDGLALVRIDRSDDVGFERLELRNGGKVPCDRPVGAEAGSEHSGGAKSEDEAEESKNLFFVEFFDADPEKRPPLAGGGVFSGHCGEFSIYQNPTQKPNLCPKSGDETKSGDVLQGATL